MYENIAYFIGQMKLIKTDCSNNQRRLIVLIRSCVIFFHKNVLF